VTTGRRLRPVAWAVGTVLVGRVVGLNWLDGVLVGLGALVLAVVAGTVATRTTAHPWPPADPADTAGARRELAALTWTFTGVRGQISESAIRRLRADATRRLARAGVVVPGGVGPAAARAPSGAAHEARALLGDRVWTMLTSPGGRMASLADLAHAVDVLERLVPEPTEGSAP
jgi:hypothetical protein